MSRGWRSLPCGVHSMKDTCTTTSGRTQCARTRGTPVPFVNGGVGCSLETLAELIGDTPKVAFDHYGKEWGQHYQDPLWAAVGVPPPDGPSPQERDHTRPRRKKRSRRG